MTPPVENWMKADRKELLELAQMLGRMTEEGLGELNAEGWPPHVVVLCDDANGSRDVAVFVLAGGDSEDWKDVLMRGIGRQVFEMRKFPVAVCLSSEAWVVRRKLSTTDPSVLRDVVPSKEPDKLEVIILAGATINDNAICNGMMTVTRTRDNKIRPGKFQKIEIRDGEAYIVDKVFKGFFEAGAEFIAERDRERAGGEDHIADGST